MKLGDIAPMYLIGWTLQDCATGRLPKKPLLAFDGAASTEPDPDDTYPGGGGSERGIERKRELTRA